MATPWSEINEIFFDMVEEDSGFFNYFNVNDTEAYALAVQRANSMLKEAINHLMRECECEIDLYDYYEDQTGEMFFTEDLTPTEINLLANLQYEAYLKRDVAKLRAFSHQYTPSDLQVFSPANDRKTFMEMYNVVCDENKLRIDRYKSKDRLTGENKMIDYTSYDDDE